MASGSKVVFVRSPSIGVYPRKKKPGTAEDRFSGRGVCCQKNSQPLEDRYRLRPAMLTTCTVRLRSTGAIIQKDISIALQVPEVFRNGCLRLCRKRYVGALGDSVGTDFTASFEEPWNFASFAYRSAIEARCRQHTLALRRPKPTARPC